MSECIKNMYPSKIDLTKDECRGVLRRLELEAYSSVVSTFRAQGNLDSNKQTVLDQLRRCFHISEDRHKAEIRRVANNEKLTTISELINGKSFDLEWTKEGHRSYPLISRAPSYTALHMLADHASKFASQENIQLPDPIDTKRDRNLDVEITGKPFALDDPTKPPTTSPAIFGISRKDLKRSIDLVTLHTHTKKKHYHHLKPPPIPNMKIQHLYQSLNTKRPRKSFTKKSKTKPTKQSPSRMQYSYPAAALDDKNFHDGELQRHLTSQLMPPPQALKYTQSLPTTAASKKDYNQLKMNHIHQQQQQQQQHHLEPQPHYIPNNRLKSESSMQESPSSSTSSHRTGRSKNVPSKSNYNSKYANGSGTSRSMDHIPDPQIIFSTTSSTNMNMKMPDTSSSDQASLPLQNNDIELPAITSPLQLLSTAASCTPKLKVTSPVNNSSNTSNNMMQQQQLPQPSTSAQLPSMPSTAAQQNNPLKVIQNRAIKIIPQQQAQQQSVVPTTPSKFKIQKIQLVMNKNQDGATNISPSATIVSGKAGQLVLSGKSITNTYQVGTKSPYTILSSGTKVGNGPKVIVQAIDRNFAQQKEPQADNSPVVSSTVEKIPESQRITESTPIDFLPTSSTTVPTPATSFPKVIIQKSVAAAPKQIKLKIAPASIVNSKLIKGLPSNLKFQRNISTKGFTVVNSSQLVQIQQSTPQNLIQTAAVAAAAASPTTTPATLAIPQAAKITESTKSNSNTKESTTDWEQELDDANRTKERFVVGESNGASVAKKPRLDESAESIQEIVQTSNDNNNIIIESSDIESSSNIIYENLPQKQQQPTPEMSEFVYIQTDEDEAKQQQQQQQSDSSQVVAQEIINGDDDSTKLNGQFEEVQMQEVEEEEEIRNTHNGAEAYENLVKSLEADCDPEYIKDMSDDPQIDENYGFIDGNVLDMRESERLYQ